MSRLRTVMLVASTLSMGIGCTALLGIDLDRARLEEAEGGTADDAGGAETGLEEVPPPIKPSCGATEKVCSGACASKNDPLHGCGGESCEPCWLPYSLSATCIDGKCAALECVTGRKDCDGKPENGCETKLGTANSCGGCNTKCGGATPRCAPKGETWECVAACSPTQRECPLQGACIELDGGTTVDFCGSTNCDPCPNGVGTTPTCDNGQCGVDCQSGFATCLSPTTCTALSDLFIDEDGDGYGVGSAFKGCATDAGKAALVAGDCNDRDNRAFPGQSQRFAAPTDAGSFDFDCNGVETPRSFQTAPGNCNYPACNGAGYLPGPARPGDAGVNGYCGSTTVFCCSSLSITCQTTSSSGSSSAAGASSLRPLDVGECSTGTVAASAVTCN